MFKKITITLASAMLLFITTTSQSNAALITQDLLFLEDGATETTVAGSITISTNHLDSFGEAFQWMSFTLFGSQMMTEMDDPSLFGGFLAIADASNPMAGLEFLSFDVTDANTQSISYNGISDPFNDDHFLDIFNLSDSSLSTFGELSFGDVSVVPEPSAFALMALALGLISLRLKRSN